MVSSKKDGMYHIDEIKTSEPRFEDLEPEQVELFFHQARVYAYIYSQENNLEEINLQLTYYQTTEEVITRKGGTSDERTTGSVFKKLTEDYQEWLIFRKIGVRYVMPH